MATFSKPQVILFAHPGCLVYDDFYLIKFNVHWVFEYFSRFLSWMVLSWEEGLVFQYMVDSVLQQRNRYITQLKLWTFGPGIIDWMQNVFKF